jgi:hypothetical protein
MASEYNAYMNESLLSSSLSLNQINFILLM